MTKGKSPDPVALAIGFVRLHARRDPLFAKGPDKARIIEAREIVAAFDAAAPDSPAGDAGKGLKQQAHEWRRGEVQAIGAAISTRSWHAAEQAYNGLRDKMDAAGCWHAPATPAPAIETDDVQATRDQYRKAWEAMFEPLSWMHESDDLKAYWGWGLAHIANDLIDRAYPTLRADALAKKARGHG